MYCIKQLYIQIKTFDKDFLNLPQIFMRSVDECVTYCPSVKQNAI